MTNAELNDNCRLIITTNGLQTQKRKFAEEAAELFEALTEWQVAPSKKTHDHVIEELADCSVMLAQFKQWFETDDDEIQAIMSAKVERTLKRLTIEQINLHL